MSQAELKSQVKLEKHCFKAEMLDLFLNNTVSKGEQNKHIHDIFFKERSLKWMLIESLVF